MDDRCAQRMIFAVSLNKIMMDTYLRSKAKTALISYYYIRRRTKAGWKTSLEAVRKIREHSDVVFIDCGVYTMKTKMMGAQVGGKPDTMPRDHLEGLKRKFTANIKVFENYATRYAAWLKRYDDLYDWAFDLDVDQLLGVDVADRFYRLLVSTVPNPRKIVRVWHMDGRTFDDWVEWCKSGEYDYLAIEGGGSHGRDYDFYHPFVDVAHKHGVKVHVLAMTDPEFLRRVNVDSGDSISWAAGGMYGYIMTPRGRIFFNSTPGKKHNLWHWDRIGKQHQKQVIEWLEESGLESQPKVLRSSYQARDIINIFYLTSMDRPYIDEEHLIRRGGFVHKVPA